MNTTLFICTTVISLVFTFLIYFGITRYIQLHYENPDKYIKNYKNISNIADINDKIIISFTTTPSRIKKITPMLNSILDQTVKVDRIVLNIPKICNNKEYDIPEKYKDILSIMKCEKNYGPATKFVPTILREDDANTIIILLDDDTIYGKDFIETILEESKKNKNKAIISKKAILCKPTHIDPNIFDKKCEFSTDKWIEDNIIAEKYILKYNENYKSFATR